MIKVERLMVENAEEDVTNMILEQVRKNKMTISNLRKITDNVIRYLESNAILEMEDSNTSESPVSSNQ